jgi:class 3 adenylate cyclase/tetratricopeptide (TPR) repeat protein
VSTVCPACGAESPEEFAFCPRCGAALGEAPAPRELRKTVTVVFSDVTGSTAIGERLDPEPLRRLMLRWYEEMKAVCEAHGGRVRELIGDAVMAAFGIPIVHEDDALRAIRAAAGMRERLEQLNDELEREFGIRLESRTGVNTGEVIVREPDPSGALALGDAVNVAARLQTAAAPGEILLGEATHRLVRDAVRAEPVEPLELKGKTGPVEAFRLLEVLPQAEALARHFETPLVGRQLELAQLRQAYERAKRERRCHLVTVFGVAGIGKTRLAQELARSVQGKATVVTGRCLSYGEGITYWPLREIVTQAAGRRSVGELLAGSPDATVVAERLESAIGTGTGGAVEEEVFWAARKLVEALAREMPLVLVFEDIHWGEPTLLDLIEHLADWVRDAPVLLVCLARPELLDERPGWGGGKLNASSLLLEPLSREESSELIQALAVGARLTPEARARIAEGAAGNPLFLEQMLAMLSQSEEGRGEIAVPPAIQALLAARLDRLEPDERRVLEHGSIEGEIFHLGGVIQLSEAVSRDALESLLMSLVRKELIRTEASALPGEDAFRFRHALIRDAVYEGISKETRSELHERHATWLEESLGDRVTEAEEILGYHLEQAYRYRAELGPLDRIALALADRASRRLGSAGRVARRRGDRQAAINLLERARLLPSSDEKEWLELAPELGAALLEASELERAETVLSEAIERAAALGLRQVERHAWLVRGLLRQFSQPGQVDLDATIHQAEESLAVLQESVDDLALTRAWILLSALYAARDAVSQRDAAERAFEHARRARSGPDEALGLGVYGFALLEGPTPADEGERICLGLLEELTNDPLAEATVGACLASFVGMQGRLEQARALLGRSRATMHDLGLGRLRLMVEVSIASHLELVAGDLAAAEATNRAAAAECAAISDDWYYVLAAVDLARVICERGDPAECLRILDETERHPSPPDLEIVIKRPAARALALARLGRVEEAERLATRAVGAAEGTHYLGFHADALLVLAEVLRLAGRPEEAATALEEAVALYERKGNVVSACKARTLLGSF